MITRIQKVLSGVAMLSLVLVGTYGISAQKVEAATTFFAPANCYTAAATSTLAYQTAGTATSTVTCALGPDGAKTATLAIQVNASSTASVWNIYAEESMNGVDWYPIALPQQASTTNPFNIAQRSFSTFAYASTTIGGTTVDLSDNRLGVNGTNNRNHYVLDIPVRMKRVRAYAALAPASTNGGVWMQIIPRQEP